nr:hypothetical protein [Tanacetum cinerariifolium]
MENTILELVEICRQKELYCMHDNVDDLFESAFNSNLLSINLNSQRLDKKKQEIKNVMEQPTECRTRMIESLHNFRVIHKSSTSLKNTSQISPVHAVAPILSTKEPEYSLSMGYEHRNTTPKMKSDEIMKSGVEELLLILSENEIIKKGLTECDRPTIFDNDEDHSIQYKEYLENSSEIASSNSNQDKEKPPQDSDIQADLFLASDNSIPSGIENFGDDSEWDIRFLEELLIDDSIPFPNNEASDFDNPSFLRPPSEPPDAEFDLEPNAREEILV